MKIVRLSVPTVVLLILLSAATLPAQEKPDTIQEDLMVTMNDSVRLQTTVYRPQASGAFPVILVRSPYSGGLGSVLGEYFAPKGFVVVFQAVRGLGGSEGQFVPFVNEKSDGMATMEWINEQSWCQGDIGIWGVSYLGFCAWQIAEENPASLKAMVVTSGWADLANFMTHNGAFQLQAHLSWFLSYAAGQQIPDEAWPQIFRTVPLNQFFKGAEAVSETAEEAYNYGQVDVPVYHITGWNDYVYPNVLEAFQALDTLPNNPPQHLLIGPWAHNDYHNSVTKVGDIDYGEQAAIDLNGAFEIAERWFDFWLKGEKNGIASEQPIKLFVMGADEWREFASWPPKEAEMQKWYLDSQGNARLPEEGAVLSLDRPERDGYDSYVYDPQDPTPTAGGATSHFFPENLGPQNQIEVEEREDVLVYTSFPFEKETTIAGPISLVIYASTTAPSTDFTGKLTVVKPDGYVQNIVDGIVRGYYEGGGENLPKMFPDSIGHYTVELGSTAIALEPGSRLRLQIASGNFPKYDRSPNTGEDPFSAEELVPATQRIYHGPSYPSCLFVPVLRQ